MKKCDFCMSALVLGTVVLFVIVVLALFILSEILGYSDVKRFLEAQGSLIAGVLGFLGVFIMIANQNKENRKLVKHNVELMQKEAIEARRIKAIGYLLHIKKEFRLLEEILRKDGVRRDDGGRISWGSLDESRLFLSYFLRDKNQGCSLCLDAINCYVLYFRNEMTEVEYRARLLACYKLLSEQPIVKLQLGFYHTMDCGDILNDPKPFFESSRGKFENHKFEEEVFLISYMNSIVIRYLEISIDEEGYEVDLWKNH